MKKPAQACSNCREAIRLDAVGALFAEQRAAVEQHLADCADCRTYARELSATAEGLRDLAAQPVEPSPGFRARWTSAVKQAEQPGAVVEMLAALIAWSRQMVWRNRRVLAALAPVWLLILVFRFTAPDVGQPAPATVARSPIEIFLAIRSEGNMQIALDRPHRAAAPVKAPAIVPRSSRTPSRRTTFREDFETRPETIFPS